MVNFIRQRSELGYKNDTPSIYLFLVVFLIGGVCIASASTPPPGKDSILNIKKIYCGVDLPGGTEINETSPGCISKAKLNSPIHYCNWRLPPGTILNFGFDFFKSKQDILFKITSPSELNISKEITLPAGTEIYLKTNRSK